MANINNFMMLKSHKLNGKNYLAWKQKLEQMLSYYDLWELVTGTKPKLDPMTNDYKWKNKSALLLLTFALEDDLLPHICSITNAIDVWKKLKNLCET